MGKSDHRLIAAKTSTPAGRMPLAVLVLCATALLLSSGRCGADEMRVRAASERVPRNRTATSAIRSISDRLNQNTDAETLRLVQLVLDLETDSFAEDLSSIHLKVESQLRSGSEDILRKYDGIVGVDSAMALAEAKADASIAKLRQVCKRYFLTPAGYAAAERLVAYWLDAGEFGLAARLADRVMKEPVHRTRITPQFRAVVASLRYIDADALSTIPPESLGSAAVQFQKQFSRYRVALTPLESGWLMLGGNETRSRIVQGSPPIPVALWKSDFFPDQASRPIQDFLYDWEGARREVDQPCSPASYPIVVDNHLIFRDSSGLRSIDVRNGKSEWSYRCNFIPVQPGGRSELARRRLVATGGPTPNSFGENSLMGTISSDGHLVYLVDSEPATDGEVETHEATPGTFVRRFRNRLVALEATGAKAGSVAWIHDGQLSERMKKQTGHAHLGFLGPPLPGTSELLCITENDVEVHLTALDPRTGEMTWTQPICTIERMEQFDQERHEIVSLPARSDGVVVCPTNTGLLVAVDQVRQNLLWAAFVDDLPDPKRSQTRFGARMAPTGYAGYHGYASHVLIGNGRVVYVPPRSSQLHCLELATGKILWSVPRGDAEFVGVVTDRIFVVSKLGCRSLSLEDGHELWSVTTGVPAGRGIAIADRYYLPLDDGRLASLDLATGRDYGTKSLRSDVALGHLVADRDRVYSLSQRGIVAFPQVDHILAESDAATQTEAGTSREIMLAEVAIVQGNLGDAERRLNGVLKANLIGRDRDRARRDLKELYFDKIAAGGDLSREDVQLLESLLETPSERFRLLVAVSMRDEIQFDGELATQLSEQGYALPANIANAAVPSDRDWTISPTVWCRLQLRNSATNPFARQVVQLQRSQRPTMRAEESLKEMERYLRAFGDSPGQASIRSYLASRYSDSGATHAAETHWLRNRADDDPHVAAEAAMRLADLWERSGFIADAARQLDALAGSFAKTPLPGGKSGADYVRALPGDRPAKQMWTQSHEPNWRVDHVEIQQLSVPREFTQLIVPQSPRETAQFQLDRTEISALGRYFRLGTQPVEFVAGTTESDDRVALTVFDQRTKARLGSLVVPVSYRLAGSDKLVSGGHLVPFGIPGGILGLSTLELGDSVPVWKQLPAELSGRRTPSVPGPSGADFASFLWRNQLYVIDPVDGTLLWSRLIPMRDSQNQRLDLIGDQRCLAVPGEDRTTDTPRRTYQVFETATGKLLSTVQPKFLPGHWVGSYGRHVVGIADTPEGRRLQIRDLLKETPDVNELIGEVTRQPILFQGELLYMGAGGEIKIFDVAQGQKKLSVQLEAPELVLPIGAVRVISDRSRYFINLQRHTPTAATSHFNQAINSQVPGIAARDDLYAFDRASGEMLWKRSIPYRSILQFPDCHVPFLVTISLVKDRVNNSLQSLTIEVIDSATGVTIGFRDNLRVDQILTTHYDGQTGRILLRGQTSDIELRFGPAEGQTLAGK